MALFKKNIFDQYLFVKRFIIRLFGTLVYFRFNWRNRPVIEGSEVFQDLPDKNVLIVSNHQTYFADVSFFYHAIYSSLSGHPNSMKYPGYLFCKKHNLYYVAAEETMKSGFLPKLLALSGAVTVNRTWRANGQNVRRKVDRSETKNIDEAMNDGWVITFPQGTTTPYAKGRIGTAILIKKHKPVVVPVVIDGFRSAFDKKGLKLKKKKTQLKMRVKKPLDIDFDNTAEEILTQVMNAIEQSPEHDFMGKLEKATKESVKS
ncbi:MAG: lysophospholipid acyltransferase family protein [Crocinitomicaceae bacterium]